MKPILIAGMALMTSAAVYGFIDFKNQKEHVKSLYDTPDLKAEKTLDEDNPEIIHKKEEAKEPETKMAEKNVPYQNVKKPSASVSEKKDPVDELIRKERKLNRKMFSRAPLDEKYLKEENKEVLEKTEAKKN